MNKRRKKGISYSNNFNVLDNINIDLNTFYGLYRKNADLRRCVEEKQENVGKDGYSLFLNKDKEKIKLENNVDVYNFLNYKEDLEEKIIGMITDLDIFGNIYLELIKNINGKIVGFERLDPRTISIISNKYGEIIKYIQRSGGDTIKFEVDEILHIKDKADLDNPQFGISKIETLIYDLLGDKEASISNYSFFKNNGIPSQLIILDREENENSIGDNDGDGDSEIDILSEQLKKSFKGGKNAHKFMIGSGIKDIKNIGTSNKDMEFLEYRKFNTERICAVMGVPKFILNYTEGTNHSNGEEQVNKFLEGTIKPLENRISRLINKLLKIGGFENIIFEYNEDLIKKYKNKIDIFDKMIKSGLMVLNEGRKKLNLEEYEDEKANKPLISKSLMLLEDVDMSIVNNIDT